MSNWKEDLEANAGPDKSNPFVQAESKRAGPGGEGHLYTEEEEELIKEIPTVIFYTRLANLILGLLMIVASMLSIVTTTSLTSAVLALYTVAFACLLCCFESGLQVVLRAIALNCGFMYSAAWRSAFMIFISTILFSFSIFGKIIGALMLVNAGFNIYAIWKYPRYEEAQRERSMNDIQDYLAENPAFAASFVKVGTAAAVANPALASAVVRGAVAGATNQGQQTNKDDKDVPAWAK